MAAIKNRYEFVAFFDVENGNPNGDPDFGNMPRIDPETNRGIITDVCIKRKIRDYVDTIKEGAPGYGIYIKSGVTLNEKDKIGLRSVGLDPDKLAANDAAAASEENANEKTGKVKKGKEKSSLQKAIATMKKDDPAIDVKVRDCMCETFYDIRTFGAVMTTYTKNGLNCGQVRGPVQLAFAESVDPIRVQAITITRQVITTEKDAENKNSEFGNKYIVPYGLYRMEGFISANLAAKTTGFSEEDLDLFWEALLNMFEYDHSAARGKMSLRKLIVFKHDSIHGNAPAYKLFDCVHAKRIDEKRVARAYSDYQITVDEDAIPNGVTVEYKA